MKKVSLLLLLAAACKASIDNRKANYNRMLSIAKNYQDEAKAYEHDNRPASLKRFADAMDSAKLYEDSAITFLDDVQRAQIRRIDSLGQAGMS